jgi:vacuolar-type H+-ATPase subunit I/STV1
MKMKTAYLTFINALVNAPRDFEKRMRIRSELSAIGFDKIFADLRKLDDEQLEGQIQTYDEENEGDKQLVNERYKHISPDPATLQLQNLEWSIAKLRELYQLYPERLEQLKPFVIDLISINPTSELGSSKWALISRSVHQISLINSLLDIGKDNALSENQEKGFLYQIDLPQLLYDIGESEADDIFPLKHELQEIEMKIQEFTKSAKVKEHQIEELRSKTKDREELLSETTKRSEALSKEVEELQGKVISLGGETPEEIQNKLLKAEKEFQSVKKERDELKEQCYKIKTETEERISELKKVY